jgi:hypothetical protein
VDEEASPQNEETYSTRVDEPEPVEQSTTSGSTTT